MSLRYFTTRIGHLSYDARNADLLFQVVSRRYEQRSMVLTTNLPFGDWAMIFPNAACATALIDRRARGAAQNSAHPIQVNSFSCPPG